jgi:hypothetical protein
MNSHIGSTSAYSTVYSTLQALSDYKAQVNEALGKDPNSWLILHLDNVQSYTKRRDLQIGWVNQMRIGTAAMVIEAEDFLPAATDIITTLRICLQLKPTHRQSVKNRILRYGSLCMRSKVSVLYEGQLRELYMHINFFRFKPLERALCHM